MKLTKLFSDDSGFRINSSQTFSVKTQASWESVRQALVFAYQMTFTGEGSHRSHRSGGSHNRKPGEILADTFQGKLAEFCFAEAMQNIGYSLSPDTSVSKLGVWDDSDFHLVGKTVGVKSTKHFGNLLLLEMKDWAEGGVYLPGTSNSNTKAIYDAMVLVRIDRELRQSLKADRLLYSSDLSWDDLVKIVRVSPWHFDIPGYATKSMLNEAVTENLTLKKGSILNGRTQIDADNYYIQSGDLISISTLIPYLESQNNE